MCCKLTSEIKHEWYSLIQQRLKLQLTKFLSVAAEVAMLERSANLEMPLKHARMKCPLWERLFKYRKKTSWDEPWSTLRLSVSFTLRSDDTYKNATAVDLTFGADSEDHWVRTRRKSSQAPMCRQQKSHTGFKSNADMSQVRNRVTRGGMNMSDHVHYCTNLTPNLHIDNHDKQFISFYGLIQFGSMISGFPHSRYLSPFLSFSKLSCSRHTAITRMMYLYLAL